MTAKAQFVELLKRMQQCAASGDFDRAAGYGEQALDLEPASVEARNFLGLILARQGNCERAIGHFRTALEYEPRSPLIHNNLGAAYLEMRQLDLALDCFVRAIDCHPGYAAAHKNLGQVHRQRGDAAAAIACFREALARMPRYAPAHLAWGDLLYSQGDLPAAADHYRQAVDIQDDPGSRMRLAMTLDGMGHHQRAIELYGAIGAAHPDYPGLQANLGQALRKIGRFDEAIACLQKAIALAPGDPIPHNGLGNCLSMRGLPAEAIESFRRALAADPGYATAHSNLLLNMNYLEREQENIYAESLRFDAQQARNLTGAGPSFANAKEADRKLRIGYVSGDFRSHSVAYFLLPLLEAHDRDRFEVCCYSTNSRRDEVTEKFESLADHWVVIRGMSDDMAAERIRRDAIDILVDLSGHTSDNRLLVFARQPAPVQVSWLGYPNTTGLRAMNYRITDVVADPCDGEADRYYTERLIRIPDGFCCFRDDPRSGPVQSPPQERYGYVTFGSFNMLAKVTPEVVGAWSDILRAVPESRLLLKASSLGDDKTKATIGDRFAAHDIDRQRVELMGLAPKEEHYRLYARIDIALDTFPYNGTTTTCEALWMGVPVITLSGRHHAGRVGASILQQLDLGEFVAHDRTAYVSLATQLASDGARRSLLRRSLRGRMSDSVLMNAAAFATRMERAYRQAWCDWCREEH